MYCTCLGALTASLNNACEDIRNKPSSWMLVGCFVMDAGRSRPSTSHLRQNLPSLCSWYVFRMYFACNTHVQRMYSMYWVMWTLHVPYVLLTLQYMKNTWYYVLVHNIMYCTCTKCVQHVLAVVYLACSYYVLSINFSCMNHVQHVLSYVYFPCTLCTTHIVVHEKYMTLCTGT